MPRKTGKEKSGAGPVSTTSNNVDSTAPSTITSIAPSTSLETDPLPTVSVNKANLAEIKAAIDDIVKRHLIDQAFTPSLLHPTVNLTLGYSSVIISLGAVLYSLRLTFEESKPILWVAVIGYGVLQSALWAWKRWVERGEVFRGKRRRIVKRIETDHIQIHTSTSLLPAPVPVLSISPDSRPSSPVSPLSPASSSLALSPSSSITQLGNHASSSDPSSTTLSSSTKTLSSFSSSGPTYLVHLTLSTTSNNGKSLIHKARVVSGKPVGEVVDDDGGVEEGEVARWISSLLGDAGLVGAEDEGLKEE